MGAKKVKNEMETFYSVKVKKQVNVPISNITVQKTQMKNGRTSYMLRAEKDGNKLVKFVNKETYQKYC
jgi:uncharacterized alkaline shock family protein YloU